jgi:hypothetical protein
MTPGIVACSNCGLKLKMPAAPAQPPQAQPPQAQPPQAQPPSGRPGAPPQRQVGSSGIYSQIGFQNGPGTPPRQPGPQQGQPLPPGTPPPGAPSDPYSYSAAPPDPYAQPGYMSPGEPPPLPPIHGLVTGPGKAGRESTGKAVPILIGAIILVIVIVGIMAVVVLGKKTVSGPEETVHKFFTELMNGDAKSISALCTPEHQPNPDQLAMLQGMFGAGGVMKLDNIKTSVSNLTATSATVTVVDATVSAAGKSVKLSDMGQGGKLTFALVLVNGQWMINDADS